jgi:proton-coupled amino acid transporter
MLGIAAISLWSFLLLVKTRLVIPGSFGGKSQLRFAMSLSLWLIESLVLDMGGTLYGNWFRQVILTSIALSQIGFVCGKFLIGDTDQDEM